MICSNGRVILGPEIRRVGLVGCGSNNEQCGEMVDKRQLDDVVFHEDHDHRPDIQYGGSERLGESKP
jgi:hypothetical protein